MLQVAVPVPVALPVTLVVSCVVCLHYIDITNIMSKPLWMKNQTNVDMTYCEHCRCWLKNDPMTIRGHEGGRGHREALKSFLIDTRKRKIADRKAEDDKARMLLQIEKDAHEAMYGPGTYMGGGGGGGGGGRGGITSAPSQQQQLLQAPRVPGGGGQFRPPIAAAVVVHSSGSGSGSGSGGGGGGGEAEEDDVGDGVYDVDGTFYLMGEHKSARALLVPGAACEALVGDNWLAAIVTGPLRDVAIPHTSLTSMLVPVSIGGTGGEGKELLASALRVPLAEETADALKAIAVAGAVEDGEGGETGLTEQVIRDDDTGFGLWSAVPAVEEEEGGNNESKTGTTTATRKRARINEDDDGGAAGSGAPSLSSLHANPSKALDRLEAHRRGVGADAHGLDDEADVGGDAFAAYNPYGGDKYKGFRLGDKVGSGGNGGGVAPEEKKPPAAATTVDGWAVIAPPAPPLHATRLPSVQVAQLDIAPPVESIAFKARAFGGAKNAVRKRIE
jgi:hypothetical protein